MVTVKKLVKLYLDGYISIETYAVIKKRLRQKKIERWKRLSRNRFDLARLSDEQCLLFFRFKKHEIKRLVEALGIPKTLRLNTREKFTGLEAFCLLLRRLSYPNRFVDLVKMFYRARNTLSTICNWMLTFIYKNTSKLLFRLRANWMDNQTFDSFATVCQDAGSYYPRIVGFIDGTCRGICRPKYDQRLQYSGYKKAHLLKYQSFVYPNGLIGRLDGPFNGHRHDAAILNLSNLKEDMNLEFDGLGWNYSLYGDPGYSNQKFIKLGYKNYRQLTTAQKSFNKEMSTLRVSVEYGFGKIIQQFAFLDFKKNQKLFKQNLKEMYFVAAILVNCQTCLRGNQISEYFDCLPPVLEHYLLS